MFEGWRYVVAWEGLPREEAAAQHALLKDPFFRDMRKAPDDRFEDWKTFRDAQKNQFLYFAFQNTFSMSSSRAKEETPASELVDTVVRVYRVDRDSIELVVEAELECPAHRFDDAR